MLHDLKYKVLDQYPKGDSGHYDINNPVPFVGKGVI